MPGNNPSLVKESLWHTPHACTLIRTCVAPGSGISLHNFKRHIWLGDLDKTTSHSTGNGTFETQDGESIAWISSAIGRPVDGRWVFHEIILFNNTQSKSLALLNNSIGLVKSTVGNEPDYIWLLK
jgi:hypothetical protein